MDMSNEVVEIVERIEDGEEISEHDSLRLMEEIFEVPYEHLEAMLARIRGEELLTTEGL